MRTSMDGHTQAHINTSLLLNHNTTLQCSLSPVSCAHIHGWAYTPLYTKPTHMACFQFTTFGCCIFCQFFFWHNITMSYLNLLKVGKPYAKFDSKKSAPIHNRNHLQQCQYSSSELTWSLVKPELRCLVLMCSRILGKSFPCCNKMYIWSPFSS